MEKTGLPTHQASWAGLWGDEPATASNQTNDLPTPRHSQHPPEGCEERGASSRPEVRVLGLSSRLEAGSRPRQR